MGCDIPEHGLEDARRRARGLVNVRFQQASVLELPFQDEASDFVWCGAVLHHTRAKCLNSASLRKLAIIVPAKPDKRN